MTGEQNDIDPLAAYFADLERSSERYRLEVYESKEFKDAVYYNKALTHHFLYAMTMIKTQVDRLQIQGHYLIPRFANLFVESIFAVCTATREGTLNTARRELRFILESSVKMSAIDLASAATPTSLQAKIDILDSQSTRFSEYVDKLHYFDGFTDPVLANQQINSLYAKLCGYVHTTPSLLVRSIKLFERGETPGRESVSALNDLNRLIFQVYDVALVRMFHSVGHSLAGDIFTQDLDGEPRWKFHKAPQVSQMSRAFDYKAERKHKAQENPDG